MGGDEAFGSRRPRPIAAAHWMIAGAFAFAVMSALAYSLRNRCDWLLIAEVRVVFMFSTSLLLAWRRGTRLAVWEPRGLWIRSLAGSASLLCNFYAMTRLPIADVLTLTNTYPLWIVVLSALALGMRPTVGEIAGVVLGIVGVGLIQRPHLGGDGLAALVAVAGSVATAVAMLGLHRLRGVDARAVVAHFAGVASVVVALILIPRGRLTHADHLFESTTWLLLGGLAVSGTIGQFCLTKAYASGPPGEIAVVGLSQVVFGLGFDVLVWGRTLDPATIAGIALVLAPSAALTARTGRRLAPRFPRPISPAPTGGSVSTIDPLSPGRATH